MQAEIVDLSDESDDDSIEIINDTNDLISTTDYKVTKKLADIECPICVDKISKATATTCGHIFCLECLQQSISSSAARGQTHKKGVGLCPLCRKEVTFKDVTVLRMKQRIKVEAPSVDAN